MYIFVGCIPSLAATFAIYEYIGLLVAFREIGSLCERIRRSFLEWFLIKAVTVVVVVVESIIKERVVCFSDNISIRSKRVFICSARDYRIGRGRFD